MNLFSLFSFTAFLAYLFIGIYALRLNSRQMLNRIFFILSLCLASWAFGAVFFYPAPSKESAWFWFRYFSVGWYLFPPVLFHFFSILTGKSLKKKEKFILFASYLPGILSYLKTLSGTFIITDLLLTSWGWTPLYEPSLWYYPVFGVYFIGLPLWGMIRVWQWTLKTAVIAKKKQGKMILFTLIPAFSATIITGIILKISGWQKLPPLAPIWILIWMLGIAYAVTRYRLMTLTPAVASEEIFSRISDLVFLTDPEGRILHCNLTSEKVMHQSAFKIKGKLFYDIFYESDTLKFLFQSQKLEKKERSFHFHLKNALHEVIPVQVTFSLFFEDHSKKNLLGILILAQDLRQIRKLEQEVRGRKLAEKKLFQIHDQLENQVEKRTLELENERSLLERILESNPFAMALIGLDGRMLRLNAAMKKMLSKTGLNENFCFFHTPLFAQQDASWILQKIRTGESVEISNTWIYPEKNSLNQENPPYCARIFLFPIFDLTHHPDKIVVIFEEITDRVTLSLQLENSEKKYRAMIEASPYAVFMLDLEFKILMANQQANRTLNQEAQKNIEEKSVLEFFDPSSREKIMEERQFLLHGRPASRGEFLCLKNGNLVFPCEVHISLHQDLQNHPLFFVMMLLDISQRKNMEEALLKKSLDLFRSNQDLQDFAYVASHDLQEPLRSVASYLQLLEKNLGPILDENHHAYLQYAVSGAKRMKKLINDLLDYSKAGKTQESPQRVALDQVIQQVLHTLDFQIKESRAVIEVSVLPELDLFENQIFQLFQNLLDNALKFRNPNNSEIHIKAEKKNQEWIISVQDNGIGIDSAYYEKIFILFKRLHSVETYPGTGIGLALCKKIMERHGGRIWLNSVLGQGTTFYLAFPIQQSVAIRSPL